MNAVECEESKLWRAKNPKPPDLPERRFVDLEKAKRFDKHTATTRNRAKVSCLYLTEKKNWVLCAQEGKSTSELRAGKYTLITPSEAALWFVDNMPKKIPDELKAEVEALEF